MHHQALKAAALQLCDDSSPRGVDIVATNDGAEERRTHLMLILLCKDVPKMMPAHAANFAVQR